MALVVAAGQSVGQPDWDALSAQHGGTKSTTKLAPTEAQIKEAGLGGDDDPAFQQRPIYRYYFNDGTYVDARTASNGADYAIVDYKPSSQYKPTESSTSVPRDAVPRTEGTPLPGGGYDNEQPVMVWRRPDGTVVKTEPLSADERKKWQEDREKSRNPGGKTDAQVKDDETKAEAQRKADDTTIVGVDYSGTGKNRKKVTTYKSGRTQTDAAPTDATPVSTSYEPDGTKVTKYDDGTETREQQAPGTRAAEQRAAEQGAFGVEPEGAPPITYTVGQMTSGLQKYSQWLSQQVKLHKDSGGKQGIAPAEATKLMERRIALAEAAIKEQGDLATAQGSQRGQDITQRGQTLGETQSRRGSAERLMTNAVSNVLPLAKGAGAGNGGLVADAITDLMGAGRGYVDAFGGFRESPEIGAEGFPALAAQRAASLNGINVAAQGGPQIFDPRAPAPAPPVAGSSTPVTPVANNPIDGSPIVPPSGLPGAMQSLQLNLPPWAGAGAGQLDPSALSGLLERGVQGPRSMVEEYDNFPRPPMRAMQEMRYGEGNYFDPEMAGAGLTQRLGIHPDIMRQAIGELYG